MAISSVQFGSADAFPVCRLTHRAVSTPTHFRCRVFFLTIPRLAFCYSFNIGAFHMLSAEQLLLDNIGTIQRIATLVARRAHFPPDDVADFTSVVMLRLIQDDYRVLRQFVGRSSFVTYIGSVIARMMLDERERRFGKWRASAEASKLGHVACTLERLTTRDGVPVHEAISMLSGAPNAAATREHLEQIYAQLPPRPQHKLRFSTALDANAHVARGTAEDDVLLAEARRSARTISQELRIFLASLADEDRLILLMRFEDACSVPAIARALGVDAKNLYKRLARLLSSTRQHLQANGIDARDIDLALDRDAQFDGKIFDDLRRSLPLSASLDTSIRSSKTPHGREE